MAFVEIHDDGPQGGDFVKLEAIGDKLIGLYMSHAKSTGNFGERVNYTFAVKDGVAIYTPQTDALRKLAKVELKQGMKVMIQVTGAKDIGKASPMRMFKVMVDTDIAPTALAAITEAKKKQAAKAPPDAAGAKPKAKPEDDPFAEPSGAGGDDIPF